MDSIIGDFLIVLLIFEKKNLRHASNKLIIDTYNPGHDILEIYLISVQVILHE